MTFKDSVTGIFQKKTYTDKGNSIASKAKGYFFTDPVKAEQARREREGLSSNYGNEQQYTAVQPRNRITYNVQGQTNGPRYKDSKLGKGRGKSQYSDLEYENRKAYERQSGKNQASLYYEQQKAKLAQEQRANSQYGPQNFSLFGATVPNLQRVTGQQQDFARKRELEKLQFEAKRAQLQRYNPQAQQTTYGQGENIQAPRSGMGMGLSMNGGGYRDPLRIPNADLGFGGGMSLGPSQQQASQQGYNNQQAQQQGYNNQQSQQQVQYQRAPEPVQDESFFRRVREGYGYKFRKLFPGEQPNPGESLFRRYRTNYGYKFVKAY